LAADARYSHSDALSGDIGRLDDRPRAPSCGKDLLASGLALSEKSAETKLLREWEYRIVHYAERSDMHPKPTWKQLIPEGYIEMRSAFAYSSLLLCRTDRGSASSLNGGLHLCMVITLVVLSSLRSHSSIEHVDLNV
jgi:hypothetical protein